MELFLIFVFLSGTTLLRQAEMPWFYFTNIFISLFFIFFIDNFKVETFDPKSK